MHSDSAIIRCSSCHTGNRIPKSRLGENPKCGKCGSPIEPETTIIPCSSCGAKNRIMRALIHDQPKCGKCHAPLRAVPVYDYVVEIMDRNFEAEVLAFPGPVLFEVYSNSCGYCHMLTPILQQLAKEYAGRLKIAKLNMDRNAMTASGYQVMSTPTMILFKEGKEVDRLLGAMQKQEIEQRLKAVL